MLTLTLARQVTQAEATLGTLTLPPPAATEFAILEPNPTKIPPGIYEMRLEWSPKFRRRLWEIKEVPGHSELKIHAGNRRKDTDGCPLIGMRHGEIDGEPAVVNSSFALRLFTELMGDAKEATLEVIN